MRKHVLQQQKKKLVLWRAVLIFLILLNMAVIFGFSAEGKAESAQKSHSVVDQVVNVTIPSFDSLPEGDQQEIFHIADHIVRKMAHMVEFGTLGLLVLLLSFTWEDRFVFLKYATALAFVFFYAATDELHQIVSSARGGLFSDTLIDLCGALLTCTAALPFLLHKQKKRERALRSRKDRHL